jgi:hypothetical protein
VGSFDGSMFMNKEEEKFSEQNNKHEYEYEYE